MINIINNISCMWWNWMASMFWQVGLLILLVACIDIVIKRWAWPQLRYALWLLVLVKLVLPPGISMPGSLTERVKPQFNQIISRNVEEPSTITKNSPFIVSVDSYAAIQQTTYSQPQVTFTQQKPEPESVTYSAVVPESPAVRLIWQSYAMAIWLLGMTVFGLSLILRLKNLRVCQSRNCSTPELPQSFHLMMLRCARQVKLGRVPRVIVTKKVVCPAVFGIIRPVLLMPKGYLRSLSRKDTEHMLLHELAHIKRGDPIVHCFYLMLQIVYWFNPLLWLARRQLIHLRELCCDATVARILKYKTNAYRQTLIDIARQFLTRPLEPGMGLLGLFEDTNRLLIRLSWLEKKTWRYQKMKNLTIIIIVTFMLTFVLPMAKAQEQSSAVEQITNVQQNEDLTSNSQNDNNSEAEPAETKEQLSEEMKTLKVQLEKLEVQKQNLQKELAKLEKSQLAANNKIKEKALQVAEKLKASEGQNSNEFTQWQQQMQKWQQEMQKWQKQFENHLQEHVITENTHENPTPTPVPHPAPPMPPMPPMPVNAFVSVNVPEVNGSAMVVTPKNAAPVIVPKVNIPKIDVTAPSVVISSVPPTGPQNIIVPGNENKKFESVREMELIPKIEPGASFVVQNKVGKIVLVPSQDGSCNVKAVIQAKAESNEKAQEMVEQVSMSNQSSGERFLLKPVKSGDDNWNGLNVDLYITVPSNIAIDVSTDVGSIEITDIKGKVKGLTNVGSINAINVEGEIQLTTKVGNIDFAVSNDLSATLKANTKVGAIESDFPLDINKTDITATTAKGTIGSGEKNIKLTTEVGKISIKKRSSTEN